VCVAVCCSVLQCAVVCCSVLCEGSYMCSGFSFDCSMLQCAAVCCTEMCGDSCTCVDFSFDTVNISILCPYVSACCSLLQRVAALLT